MKQTLTEVNNSAKYTINTVILIYQITPFSEITLAMRLCNKYLQCYFNRFANPGSMKIAMFYCLQFSRSL